MPSLLLSGRCEALCVCGGAALAHAAPVPAAGVTAVCFADAEYPSRVAFGYLSKLCEDFTQATGDRLAASDEDGCMDSAFPVRPLTRGRAALAWLAPTRAPRPRQAHPKLLQQFQDPSQADQLTRIMNELEQTKVRSTPGEPAAREES